ncbi:MAG: hypothetical protein ACODAB_02485, partial [Gemmatimonadota bacterium]
MNISTSEPSFTGRPAAWQVWAAGLAVALVVALLSALQLYISWLARGYEAAFGELLATELIEWSIWAAAAPAVVALDIRAGFD